MIVVDTNVIARLLVAGSEAGVTERVRNCDPEWTAPALLWSEFRNVLVTSMRAGRITADQAQHAIEDARGVLSGDEPAVSSKRVLDLAMRSGCTAYDCEFVSAAMDLRVPLVTSDRQVLAAFPEVAVSPEAFVAQ